MNRIILTTCMVLLASCERQAASPDTAAKSATVIDEPVAELQQNALQNQLAWQLLTSLTSEVGPRLAGTEGDARAVEWAVGKMNELGFDRVWLEPVEFPVWLRHSESGRIVSPEPLSLDLAALGGVPGTDGDLEAEIVHFPNLDALKAVEDGSLVGKIAFISERMPRSQDGSGYGRVVPQRSRGPFVAARKGASALLIRSVGTDTENSAPHTGAISSTETGTPLPSAALSNESADQLLAVLNQGQPVSVSLNLDVGFAGMGGSSNVIGEFDGSDPDQGFLLIGGHLDSWDLGTGAHDDGAGTVITMVAAKMIADLEQRPARGVRVVLFANEEQGIYGAKQYAQVHAAELSSHVIGSESDLGAGRIYDFRSRVSDAGQGEIARLESWLAPLGIPYNPHVQASGGADIGQMRKIGLPVIDLRHDASRYFDLHHTRNDVLENVDPADLQFNIAAWVTFIYWAATSDAEFGPVPPST
ncbi:MAG: M28 family peptidase [Xanthomonadales bacterium]|nr:M28 family peptidase [Gammaproteobacteria bacterium]NNL96558.1 M28 family peptidase [Xanthomonadales bacterium]